MINSAKSPVVRMKPVLIRNHSLPINCRSPIFCFPGYLFSCNYLFIFSGNHGEGRCPFLRNGLSLSTLLNIILLSILTYISHSSSCPFIAGDGA